MTRGPRQKEPGKNAQPQQRRAIDIEVESVISAARQALTDEMVSRLVTTAGAAVELTDQVNRAGLARAIPALAQMIDNGDLHRMVKPARVYSWAQDALTDEVVSRLAETVGNGL